jgi:hypothetical protein
MAFRKPRTDRQIKRDTDRVVEGVIMLAAQSFSSLQFTIDNCVQENFKRRVAERLVELGCDLTLEYNSQIECSIVGELLFASGH